MCRLLLATAAVALVVHSMPAKAQEESEPSESADQTTQPAEQPNEGRTATVIMHDGQVITGTLVGESDETITLLINGIRTTLETRKIRESYIQPPIEERYKATRASIDDDDAESLIHLVRWLMDKGRHDLALIEINGILEHEPFNDAARSLKVIAEQNIKLQKNRLEPVEREDNEPPRPSSSACSLRSRPASSTARSRSTRTPLRSRFSEIRSTRPGSATPAPPPDATAGPRPGGSSSSARRTTRPRCTTRTCTSSSIIGRTRASRCSISRSLPTASCSR